MKNTEKKSRKWLENFNLEKEVSDSLIFGKMAERRIGTRRTNQRWDYQRAIDSHTEGYSRLLVLSLF